MNKEIIFTIKADPFGFGNNPLGLVSSNMFSTLVMPSEAKSSTYADE